MTPSTKTPAQRARLVTQWRASHLTQAAFARRHHVHPRTFWDWIRRTSAPAPTGPATRFVPVHVVDDHHAPPLPEAVAIVLPRGERIHVPVGTPPTWVVAIVAGLRAPC
jgi:hypothetical protein